MTIPTTTPIPVRSTVSLLLCALAPLAAQPVTPLPAGWASASASEAPVTLSPFEVSTEKDTGYTATSTLAGSRLNDPPRALRLTLLLRTRFAGGDSNCAPTHSDRLTARKLKHSKFLSMRETTIS